MTKKKQIEFLKKEYENLKRKNENDRQFFNHTKEMNIELIDKIKKIEESKLPTERNYICLNDKPITSVYINGLCVDDMHIKELYIGMVGMGNLTVEIKK